MKCIKTEEAAGHVLCHDITQIIPGKKKGPVFKKGHIVQAEDIPILLSVGKENLYVWERHEGILHEDEAAEILRDICMGNSSTLKASEPSEGKIEIFAATDGLFKINSQKLFEVNSLGEMMIATIHGNTVVHNGDKLCGTRIIPLVIEEEKMKRAKKTAGSTPLLQILPFKLKKIGLVTTGNEIKKGLIKDGFRKVIKSKLFEFNAEIIGQTFPGDELEAIKTDILSFADKDVDMILCSGGMSVDPDDRTPGAVKACGAKIISYGAPVLPGAMFLLSYLEYNNKQIPVLGLPGCVMYAGRTIFDLVLPRLLAGECLTAADLNRYGEGGLCLGCKNCTYPNCGFGKAH